MPVADGLGAQYTFEATGTLSGTIDVVGYYETFDDLIYQFASDTCRVCETLVESCQNYDATLALCPAAEEETTEDTTVTSGPMIDGTTLILSMTGAYVASVGLLYIFKGAFA